MEGNNLPARSDCTSSLNVSAVGSVDVFQEGCSVPRSAQSAPSSGHQTEPHTTVHSNKTFINNYPKVDSVDNRVTNIRDNSTHKYGSVGTIDNRLTVVVDNLERLQTIPNVQNAVDNEMSGIFLFRELPSPTELFTGRDDHLETMREYFEVGAIGNPKPSVENLSRKRKAFVLHGLGGSGKTQVALEFAELHGSWFWKIFFIDASNAGLLRVQLASIAKKFKVGKTAHEALTWLFEQKENWLMIFDNADDPNLNLRRYFPGGNHGNIIITTRNKGCISYARQSNIHVADLHPHVAANLLLKAAMLGDSPDGATIQSVRLLVKELGFLPLAITQAGAYIAQNSNIEEYLDVLKKRRKEILRNRNYNVQNMDDRELPVYISWDVSYESLDDSAKDFLKICSFLHNEGIPKAIFEDGVPRLLHSGHEESPELGVWNQILRSHWIKDGEWDELKFNHTITQLTSYSLVTVSERASLFSFHGLVHCWVRDILDAETAIAIHATTTKLLITCLSIQGSSSSVYKIRRQLLPHAVTVLDSPNIDLDGMSLVTGAYFDNGQFEEFGILGAQAVEMIEAYAKHWKDPSVLTTMVLIYLHQGKLDKAEKLWNEAQKVLGAGYRYTFSSKETVAHIYHKQGRLVEAETLYLEIIEAQRVLGGENPYILPSLAGLVQIFIEQGRLAEAEKLQSEALEVQRKVFGAEQPITLFWTNGLAMIYVKQGRLAEAEKLLSEALEADQRELGGDHHVTLHCMDLLAIIYDMQGRLAEAEKLLNEVLEVRKRVLEAEHPDTLGSKNILARVYFKREQFVEAVALYTEVIETRRRELGDEHPNTVASIGDLALAYFKLGQLTEAEKLLSEVLEARKRELGDEHRMTLYCMDLLAIIYDMQGRLAEAEKLLNEVLEVRKRVLGAEHPDTFGSKNTLARIYYKRERFIEAAALYTEVIETLKRELGDEDPDTIESMRSLASAYHKQGRLADAEKLLSEVLKGYRRVFRDEHPKTLEIMNELATLYCKQGKYEKAQEMYVEALEVQKRTLGDEHPDTIDTLRALQTVVELGYPSSGCTIN